MNLATLVQAARERGASDLHLEPGLPPTVRISSSLQPIGDPLSRDAAQAFAMEAVGEDNWPALESRGSFDASRTVAGVRCRINVLQTTRGMGLAIRLLASFQATLERLNLHPELRRFCAAPHGLILMSGPTGSGKSSTMAALIQEINQTQSRHIITLEQPIEYQFTPIRSFIRQREVGRDTPTFEQALIDAMREDPDVLMVGEMRDPETMRLTLNASETGHLVLATVHSSSAPEALQRVISAFPSEIQNSIAAQLADCLAGVICQRLRFDNQAGIRLPECEILHPTHAIKNFIRRGEFHQIPSAMETGADHGMFTFARYRAWMSAKREWQIPPKRGEAIPEEQVITSRPAPSPTPSPRPSSVSAPTPKPAPATSKPASGSRIEIEPEEGFGKILKR